jgi:chromate transport protein ChrA
MQTLGLSDSTPKPTSRLRDLFWPDLSVDTSAESACDTASWACFAIAGITTLVGVWNNPSVLIDALLFVLIGFGLRKKWRSAAVAGFLLYVLEVLVGISMGQVPGILTILILAILFNSIRASYAYRRLRKTEVAEKKIAEVFD